MFGTHTTAPRGHSWQTRRVIVVVAPGQGSQTPGFLEPWIAEPRFKEHLERISDTVGIDLVKHGTVSDADTIRDTAVAQPLIVAAGLLALEGLVPEKGKPKIDGTAGHSVGEVTASVVAGILSEEEALRFVKRRSQGMADASKLVKTGMSAVIGGDEEALLALLTELDLYPANFNGGGQIRCGGRTPRSCKAVQESRARIARNPAAGRGSIPHPVHGAVGRSAARSCRVDLGERPGIADLDKPGRFTGRKRHDIR